MVVEETYISRFDLVGNVISVEECIYDHVRDSTDTSKMLAFISNLPLQNDTVTNQNALIVLWHNPG